LKNWAEIFREFVAKKMKIFAYAGHGPATVKLFVDMWKKE
jgi:hypothetical protein